jgi:hypothetical protein
MTVIASWFGTYQVLDVGRLDKCGDKMGGFGLIIFFNCLPMLLYTVVE